MRVQLKNVVILLLASFIAWQLVFSRALLGVAWIGSTIGGPATMLPPHFYPVLGYLLVVLILGTIGVGYAVLRDQGAVGLKAWSKKRERKRKRAQEGKDLAAFAGDFPILTEEVKPARNRSFPDPHQLVPTWRVEKTEIDKAHNTPIKNARSSFRMWCEKNNHPVPEDPHWLAGRLRELGFEVAYVKGDRKLGVPSGRAIKGLRLK